MEKEYQQIKYIRELQDYWSDFIDAVISEIFAGTGIALGLTEKEAYKLVTRNPKNLQKAGFFKHIYERFKSLFKHKIPDFRPHGHFSETKKPITQEQWDRFNDYLDRYWRGVANRITEDVAVKGYMLGRDTTHFKQKKKPYQNKSLYQVVKDQYKGKMPKSITEAYKNYDFKNSEKKILNQAFSQTAMYVTQTNNELKEAIRQQIQNGIEEGKSNVEIASDLYWHVEKDKKLRNKYKAQTIRHNWQRVANYEVAALYEAGQLAPYESEAMESLEEPEKAQYFARTGGTCAWCRSVVGTIVRLVPTDIVTDTGNESLKSMGIHDPNTDIAIWIGKNNVGLRQNEWLICCPAHPHNVATFTPIDLKTEYYNDKSGRVEKRHVKEKFIPAETDYTYRSKEEKEYRKPTFIGDDLVRYNNNVYERVEPDEYVRKKTAWDKNPSLPIPVATDSTRYDKIFGEAERQ